MILTFAAHVGPELFAWHIAEGNAPHWNNEKDDCFHLMSIMPH